VPLTGSFQIFKENFCEDFEGSQRLTALLSKYMIRRTHSSTFCGAKLLSLPRASGAVLYLEFTEVERTIYDIGK
jgi:SNF2 family DNA or RNA helicase